jgi:hypothetical protein
MVADPRRSKGQATPHVDDPITSAETSLELIIRLIDDEEIDPNLTQMTERGFCIFLN